MLATPPIDLSEVLLLENLRLGFSPLVLRLIGIGLLSLNSFLFARLFSKKLLPFIVFLINPWTVYLHTFFTFQCVAITLSLVLLKKQKFLFFLFLAIFALLYFVKILPSDYSFPAKLRPSVLALEINERQKIDFLATNKTFILPSFLRKITYNKPFLAIDTSIRQFISFFDWERMVAPRESYEIIKLSGFSPKGNFPFFFLWEIPLILFGFFLNRKFGPYFLVALIPLFAAEEKLFGETAFLALPILLFWEVTGLLFVLEKIKLKIFLSIAVLAFIAFIFPYYFTFYTKPLMYKTSESFFYEEIAKWILQNPDKNVIVTNAFGPTDKMVKYYLGTSPNNVIFDSFNLVGKTANKNTYYIGLPGQFVKHGKDLKITASQVPIVEEIKGDGELVFEYGEDLWIGYQK